MGVGPPSRYLSLSLCLILEIAKSIKDPGYLTEEFNKIILTFGLTCKNNKSFSPTAAQLEKK
jgi:hypothetical protein